MTSAEDYQCTLDESDLKRAKNELHENPRHILGAVEQLRKWILDSRHIKFPTDSPTLIIYLRHSKFSQLRVRNVIERTCTMHITYPILFKDWTMDDPAVYEIFQSGFCIQLPGRRKKGQSRILLSPGLLDVDKINMPAFFRANMMFLKYFLLDETVQVCGLDWLVDMSGVGVKIQKFLCKKELKLYGEHAGKTLPIRCKSQWYYNATPIAELAPRLFLTLAPKKIKDRTYFTGNMEKVYETFPKECLPKEYLPDDYKGQCLGTKREMTERFLDKLADPRVQELWDYLSAGEWGIDASAKVSRKHGLVQTFRRLSTFHTYK